MTKYYFGYYLWHGRIHSEKWSDAAVNHNITDAVQFHELDETAFQQPLLVLEDQYPLISTGKV